MANPLFEEVMRITSPTRALFAGLSFHGMLPASWNFDKHREIAYLDRNELQRS